MNARIPLSLFLLSVFLLLLGCSGLDDNTLASINGELVALDEFTSKTPASRFVGKDTDFIDSKVDEFIKKDLFTRVALDRNFASDPVIQEKIQKAAHRQMLQYVFERAIVDEVINEEYLLNQFNKSGTELKARHILIQHAGIPRSRAVRTNSEALVLLDEIAARLSAGESFEALAGEFTDDPSGKQSGGDLGWFRHGTMVEPFWDAVFALKPGKVSGVVETPFGYHIIKLEEQRDVKRGAFNEERAALLQQSRQQKSDELRSRGAAFLDALLPGAGFKMNSKSIHNFYMVYEKSAYQGLVMDEVFTKLSFSAPLFSLNGEELGGQWIIGELKKLEEGQKPRFNSEIQFKTILEQLVTQTLILDFGYTKNYHTEDAFTSQLDAFTRRQVYDAFILKEINDRVEPGDEALMAFYDANKSDRYLDKKKVQVREIFVKDSLLAVDLKKRIDAGEDIGWLAERHTERKTAKENQGELPPFQEGRYGMMGKKAFSMQAGEIAGPIQLGNGYSIVKLEGFIPEGPKPYTQVKGRVKNELLREMRDQRTSDLYDELTKEYSVKINYSAVRDFYAATEGAEEK